LWLSAGGSAGHSDLWAVDIAEGKRTDPEGRKWEVELLSASEARERAQAAAEGRKADQAASKAAARLEADKTSVCRVLARFNAGETKEVIRTRAGLSGGRVSAAMAALIESGDVVSVDIQKPNRKKPYEGFTLKADE
jgi:hypothetical protein